MKLVSYTRRVQETPTAVLWDGSPESAREILDWAQNEDVYLTHLPAGPKRKAIILTSTGTAYPGDLIVDLGPGRSIPSRFVARLAEMFETDWEPTSTVDIEPNDIL